MSPDEYEAKLILDEMRTKKSFCSNRTKFSSGISHCYLLDKVVSPDNKCISHQPIYVHPLDKSKINKSNHSKSSPVRFMRRGNK